jgi:hypothetical protein
MALNKTGDTTLSCLTPLVLNHPDLPNFVLNTVCMIIVCLLQFLRYSDTLHLLMLDQIFSIFILSYVFLKKFPYPYQIPDVSQVTVSLYRSNLLGSHSTVRVLKQRS